MKKLTLIFTVILLFSLSSFVNADDGLLKFSVGDEAEAGMTGPGATRSFLVSFTNANSTSDISSLSASFTNSDYNFLGGSFPGIGGDCSATNIASASSCSVMIEHSPSSIGDSDSYLNLSYQLTTDTLGSSHNFEALIDGHSTNVEIAGCSALAPIYTSQSLSSLGTGTSALVSVSGQNFSIATQVSLSLGSISNFQIIDASSIQFVVNAPSSTGNADLIIQNECGSVTQSNALSYILPANGWVNLNDASGVALADPKFTSPSINGISIDSNFGIQVDVATTSWNQYLKFDGVCNPVSSNFEIILYRSGTTGRLMPSLINQATNINPWPGTNAWRRQYIGVWSDGSSANRTYGSQQGEGGSLWSQGFTTVSFQAGKYYKFVFRSAGQSGNLVEIYEVDAAFNEITQLVSYTSNKVATSATSVCAGIIPYSTGLSDYYIRAVRSF